MSDNGLVEEILIQIKDSISKIIKRFKPILSSDDFFLNQSYSMP